MKRYFIAALFCAYAFVSHAQTAYPGSTGHGNPTVACAVNDTYGDLDSGLVWVCNPTNTWKPTPQYDPWSTPTSGQCKVGNGTTWVTGACGSGSSISLTTTGTSGAATLTGSVLNIPVYTYTLPTASTSVLGGVKVDGTTITIASGVISATTGGSGTVTSFSAAALSPLFTTSVATPTSTPALSFTLSTAAANTVFGNFTGATAAPTFSASPAFSGANITALNAGNVSSGTLAAARGGTGVSNTATLTLGSSNQNWGTLGTGIVKNTTTTGALSVATFSDVIALWTTGACSSTTFLRGDGVCATPSGSGSGTVNSGTANQIAFYSATGTAVSGDSNLTDNGTTLSYSGSGGISLPGDGTHAAILSLYPNTTLPALTSGDFSFLGPNAATVTAFAWQLPTAANGSAGVLHVGAPASSVSQLSVSAVSLTSDVSGVLPVANGGSPAVADTTFTVGTTAIAANSCSTASTVTMTNLTTSMALMITPSTDVSSTTGWSPGTGGQLYFTAWPSAANTASYEVCNPTSASITPGASTTWNIAAR